MKKKTDPCLKLCRSIPGKLKVQNMRKQHLTASKTKLDSVPYIVDLDKLKQVVRTPILQFQIIMGLKTYRNIESHVNYQKRTLPLARIINY